jgi:hypothetical protein
MKKLITLIAFIFLLAGLSHNIISSPDGAPSGYAFDKSSSYKTCATSGCHSGTAVIADTSIAKITSNIPSTGYVPGVTYTFTATVNKPNNVRFGFQASPQDSLGNYKGTMIVTNTAKTKITGTKYITHTQSGNSQSSWSWNWVAPALGSGQVKMSGALMAANNNGSTSGDSVYKVSTIINECFKAPTNIVATPKGVSVAISWTKISCATGYKIMYHAVGSPTWKYITLPDTATKSIYGLAYSTDYEYAIASINGTTLSAYSVTKYFTTLCNCPAPAYFLDSLTATSNRFNWTDDSCGVRYKIQYKKSTAAAWTTKIVGDTVNQYTISPLATNTTYVYQFRKECNSGGTYNSTWITGSFTTPVLKQVVVKITDQFGNITEPVSGKLLLYYYNDGTVKKIIIN